MQEFIINKGLNWALANPQKAATVISRGIKGVQMARRMYQKGKRPLAAVAAGAGAYRAFKRRKTAWSVRPRNSGSNMIDRVTQQKDYAVISVSRNKRNVRRAKKWKRYVKKVNKAVAAFGPSKKLVKTYNLTRDVTAAELNADREPGLAWGAVGRQEVIHLPMFQYTAGVPANNQAGDDINEMISTLTNDENENYSQTLTTPIFIKSGLWEFIITNFSGNVNYVDIYHYTVKKTGVYDYVDLINATDAQVAAGPIPAAGTRYITTPGVTDYGWTPYQSRVLMQYINIFKKERFNLAAGQSVQLERRMKVNKMWRKEQTNSATAASVENKIVRGISQGVIIIAYGAPQNNENQRITGQLNLNISCNKTLFYEKGSVKYPATGDRDVEWRTYQ